MARYSAITAVDPAMQRAKAMLLPFRFGTWLKMGFIGWLAGEMVSFHFGFPSFPGGSPSSSQPAPRSSGPAVQWPSHDGMVLIAVAAVLLAAVVLVFAFLYSRFRFVIFDSVVNAQVAIGRGWHAYRSQGARYFGFWLLFCLISFAIIAVLVGLPLWHAFQRGVFDGGRETLPDILVLFGSVFLSLFFLGLALFVVGSLAKDFLVPLMALDDLSIGQAISALARIIKADPGAFAGYLGMKFVLHIVVGILFVVAFLCGLLILAIPAAILGVLVVTSLKSASGAVAIGVGIAAVLCVVAFIAAGSCLSFLCTAPVAAFLASYALFFFGGHYPKLGALLWPPPPPIPQSEGISPVVTV
jgi:hypothetical protein